MGWLVVVYGLVTAIVLLTGVFVFARRRDRYDIIDSAWGTVFIAVAIVAYVSQPTIVLASIQTVVLLLICIWGYRLFRHIFSRWSHSSSEDGRYVDLRRQYEKKPGGVALNMFARVFIVQAVLAVLVSSSVLVVMATPAVAVSWLTFVGVVLWLIGFYFEVVGDAQLKAYLANPKNKGTLMTSGLWRYTRHPNYFGEMTQWWAIFIIALGAPFWYLSIIGPIAITYLLLFISGVALSEKRFQGRKGWSDYVRRTSKLLPRPPRP